jgi:endonuclease YncB( thermonuclease family)
MQFDSTAPLLNDSGQPLTDDSLVAVRAESTATVQDADEGGDATDYSSASSIALAAVDGNVVGIGAPLVNTSSDFSYDHDEFLLNVYDDLLGGSGTVLHDESHGQFYTLTANDGDDFQSFAAYTEANGYTYQKTEDLSADLSSADAVVITSPSDSFSSSELSDLSNFVDNGGVVFLHSQSDFNNFDQTDNINKIASELGVGFRFDDSQVVDSSSNAGAEFVPTTTNYNTNNFSAYFQPRSGIDEANELDPTQTYTVDVTEVTDGDTVTVEFVGDNGFLTTGTRTEEIRVLGVDTPEKPVSSGAERPVEWEGLADRVGVTEIQFGSTTSLLDDAKEPLDDDTVAVTAEPEATVTDQNGGDAVTYPDDTPIPLVAVDGQVVGFGSTFVDDTDLQFNKQLDNEEFLLNVWDSLLGGSGTVRWDTGHSQTQQFSAFSTFESYAEANGYTVESGTTVPSDTSSVDGLVVASPGGSFSSSELSNLSSFVADGGAVFLFAQSDFDGQDNVGNLNGVASELSVGFRFNDAQVEDQTNNTGSSFRPTTTRFDPEFDLFRERAGVDDELTLAAEGSPVEEIRFADAQPLYDASTQPLSDDTLVPVRAEPNAVVTNQDSSDAPPSYPDGTAIPFVVVDSDQPVVGVANDNVTDDDLEFAGGKDNEEFLLNLLDSELGGSGAIRWDESHGQDGLSAHSTFQTYAENNGYTLESGSGIPSDTSSVDALVVSNPSTPFDSSEETAVSDFVADGGLLLVFGQADFEDADQTANLNAVASAVSADFRFGDGQVQDDQNNTGEAFRLTTTNLNTTDFSLFGARPGVDDSGGDTFDNTYPYLSYWAIQATEFAQTELSGERVEISFDDAGSTFNDGVTDPFGRLLAYIDYDADDSGSRDTRFNERLIEEGYARSYGSSLSQLETLLGAELTARQNDTGVWRQSNPNRSPEIRDGDYSELFVPKATVVDSSSGSVASDRVIVAAESSASQSDAPLLAVDTATNTAVAGGLLIDESYEQAEGFGVDTSTYGNFPLVTSVADELAADGRTGPILIEGGHGQFNTDAGLSSEDAAYYQRYLEGQDIGFEGINDLTASRLSNARAVIMTTPLEAFESAEQTALSEFVTNGGAVVFMTDSRADSTQAGYLNDVASAVGTDLRVSTTSVTDSSSNLNGDETLPVTSRLGGSLSVTGPFSSNTQESTGPTVSVSFPNGQTVSGNTATAAITLSNVPDGLAGYKLTATVDDTSVAEVSSASYATLALTQSPDVAADGSTVTLEATDTEDDVQGAVTDLELARLDLAVEGDGETTLSVSVSSLDDDDGDAVTVTTVAGTLTVSSDGPAAVGDGSDPRDPDDDGLYEDVDGDGDTDQDDVRLLFDEKESDAVTDNADAYDFNDNGRIDYDDINELYDEIVEN